MPSASTPTAISPSVDSRTRAAKSPGERKDFGAAMYGYDAPAGGICLRKYAQPRFFGGELVPTKGRQAAGAARAGSWCRGRCAGLSRADAGLQHGDVLLEVRLEAVQRIGELIILQGLRII